MYLQRLNIYLSRWVNKLSIILSMRSFDLELSWSKSRNFEYFRKQNFFKPTKFYASKFNLQFVYSHRNQILGHENMKNSVSTIFLSLKIQSTLNLRVGGTGGTRGARNPLLWGRKGQNPKDLPIFLVL